MTKCIRSPPTRLGKLYRSTLRDHVKVTFVVFLIWAFYCSIAPCSCDEDANSEIYLPFVFSVIFPPMDSYVETVDVSFEFSPTLPQDRWPNNSPAMCAWHPSANR